MYLWMNCYWNDNVRISVEKCCCWKDWQMGWKYLTVCLRLRRRRIRPGRIRHKKILWWTTSGNRQRKPEKRQNLKKVKLKVKTKFPHNSFDKKSLNSQIRKKWTQRNNNDVTQSLTTQLNKVIQDLDKTEGSWLNKIIDTIKRTKSIIT